MGALALAAAVVDEAVHQARGMAFALVGRIDHYRHDHHVGRGQVMLTIP